MMKQAGCHCRKFVSFVEDFVSSWQGDPQEMIMGSSSHGSVGNIAGLQDIAEALIWIVRETVRIGLSTRLNVDRNLTISYTIRFAFRAAMRMLRLILGQISVGNQFARNEMRFRNDTKLPTIFIM
jgi:hypothetical protein